MAQNWPIAAAMLPFGSTDSHGGPIHDAAPEDWARHLRLVRRIGFTEVDPTHTWVRVGDLETERLEEFRAVLGDVGLTGPGHSTSRRSVMDPVHRKEYLAYSHRRSTPRPPWTYPWSVSLLPGLHPRPRQAQWFWLAEGWRRRRVARRRARARRH